MAKNEVATKKKTEVAINDDALDLIVQNLGDGLSNVTTQDILIPRFQILQPMSPEVSDKTVKNNRPGNIINKANKETFDGDTGIRVIPCEFYRNYVEWEKRGQGTSKAPVNVHPATSDIMSKTKRDPNDKLNYLSNGNYVDEVANHLVVVLDEDDLPLSKAMITMKVSQMKKSRMWLYMQKTAILKVGERVIQNPPSYSFVYNLTSTLESSGGNPVHGWVIEREGMVKKKETLEQCISFAKSFQEGDVGVAADHDEEQSNSSDSMVDVTPTEEKEEVTGVKF